MKSGQIKKWVILKIGFASSQGKSMVFDKMKSKREFGIFYI